MPYSLLLSWLAGAAGAAGLVAAVSAAVVPAPAPPPVALRGQLTHLRVGRGTCYLALFAAPEGFPRQVGRAVRKLRLPVGGTACTFSFEGLPPGNYALSAFHDENDNGRLDANLVGIPTERIGFSNDARGVFGPPAFAAARVAVPGTGAALVVRMH